jgi:lipoate-protein ligase B
MIECTDVGYMHYAQALEWQKSLVEQRRKGEIEDRLILLEHPPVFTFGRRDASKDLLVSEAWLRKNGMEVYKTDRGGLVTYHGPGQAVGYLIFKLKDSIPLLVWKIEEALLRLLGHFQLECERDPEHPGIWIENRKIAAVGLHISKGITMHGFALNVTCDLRPFSYINPCGIKDREVTSMEKELGWRPSMRDVKHTLLEKFADVFETTISVQGTSATYSE